MKIIYYCCALILALANAASGASDIQTYFSPGDGCVDAMVKEINSARSSVKIATKVFNSGDITGALIGAHGRGVSVTVILGQEATGAEAESADILRSKKISVFVYTACPMDLKFLIIDEKTVISGSFDFVFRATKNANDLVVIKDNVKIAGRYLQRWTELCTRIRSYKS